MATRIFQILEMVINMESDFATIHFIKPNFLFFGAIFNDGGFAEFFLTKSVILLNLFFDILIDISEHMTVSKMIFLDVKVINLT